MSQNEEIMPRVRSAERRYKASKAMADVPASDTSRFATLNDVNRRGVATTLFTGNYSEAALNALSPTLYTAALITAACTPSASGSTAATAGSILEYQGATLGWRTLVAAVNGVPPAGTTVIVSNGVLVSPLVDGADERKIGVFDGASLIPTLSSPVSGDTRQIVNATSLLNKLEVYYGSNSTWQVHPGAVLVLGFNPTASIDAVLGVTAGTLAMNSLTGELFVCTSPTATAATWVARGWGSAQRLATGADALNNIAANTDVVHATTFDLLAGIPAGSVIETWSVHVATLTNGTNTWQPKHKVCGVLAASGPAAFDPANGDMIVLYSKCLVGVGGASGKLHVLESRSQATAGGATTAADFTTVPQSVDNSVNFSSAHLVQAYERFSAQSTSNTGELRLLEVRVTSPNV